MSEIIRFFEKNFYKISVLIIVMFLIGFLIFSYFYFGVTLMESEFITLFIFEANLYPPRLLSADNVVIKHFNKTQKTDINWLNIQDIFAVSQ